MNNKKCDTSFSSFNSGDRVLLKIRDLEKTFQNPASGESLTILKHLDFDVPEQTKIAILGHSGCGKVISYI